MIYAIIENNTVINTIIADSEEIVKVIAGDNTYLEMSETPLSVGDFLDNGKWYPKKPDYPCEWHLPTQQWLTIEEISAYDQWWIENERLIAESLEKNQET